MILQAEMFQYNETAGFTNWRDQCTGIAGAGPVSRQLYATTAGEGFGRVVAADIVPVPSKR